MSLSKATLTLGRALTAAFVGTPMVNVHRLRFFRSPWVAFRLSEHQVRMAKSHSEQPVMSNLIGYARVSTTDQSTDTQIAALQAAGCTLIRTEKLSGRSREGRTELQTILDFLRPGDTMVVTKLDRLGRSTRDVLNLVHELAEKGASLRVLEPAISTDGPVGKMVLTVLGMVAEMELGFIRDRQRAGIEQAKARGVYKGRPVSLDHNAIQKMRKEGRGATEIAKAIGCSRGAVYKALSSVGAA